MPEQYDDLYTAVVLDDAGSRVGGVSQLYLDDATGEPTFVTARTGLFGNKEVYVPLEGATYADGVIQVPYPIDAIKVAPAPSPVRHLDPQQEAQIYRHYGLRFTMPDEVPAPQSQAGDAPQSPRPDDETPPAGPQDPALDH